MTKELAQHIASLERADAELDTIRAFLRDDPRPHATTHHRTLAQAQGTIAAVLRGMRDAAGEV